jgi:hypothetical protein
MEGMERSKNENDRRKNGNERENGRNSHGDIEKNTIISY